MDAYAKYLDISQFTDPQRTGNNDMVATLIKLNFCSSFVHCPASDMVPGVRRKFKQVDVATRVRSDEVA